jgi:hypothetical protein
MIIRWMGRRSAGRQAWLIPGLLPSFRTASSGITVVTATMGLGQYFTEPGGSILLTRHAIHVG